MLMEVSHQSLMLVRIVVGVSSTQSRQRKHQPAGSISISPRAVETLCCESIPRSEARIVTLLWVLFSLRVDASNLLLCRTPTLDLFLNLQ